ncbi:hypothetical protein [Dactylosporangium darangshiense]|uniref:DUF4386 domain-containing protein n=1 Tax=Dactylosporangium darangshiense TaxID=579108 RepID=A0ABP8DQQ4_9ACTN
MSELSTVVDGRAASLRLAAVGALGFTVLYLLHRIGQGLGPDDAAPATVAAYQASHRGVLLASEVALALALLVFVAVPAGLVPLVWKAGQEGLAVAIGVTSTVFVAMGFVSSASETALANVGDERAAVLALNQLQGRVPVVFAFTALAACIGWAILRTGLAWRWLGIVSLVAAAVFLLGSIFSVLGPTPEGRSSIYGIGLSILWTLLLGIGLLRTSRAKA